MSSLPQITACDKGRGRSAEDDCLVLELELMLDLLAMIAMFLFLQNLGHFVPRNSDCRSNLTLLLHCLVLSSEKEMVLVS